MQSWNIWDKKRTCTHSQTLPSTSCTAFFSFLSLSQGEAWVSLRDSFNDQVKGLEFPQLEHMRPWRQSGQSARQQVGITDLCRSHCCSSIPAEDVSRRPLADGMLLIFYLQCVNSLTFRFSFTLCYQDWKSDILKLPPCKFTDALCNWSGL